MTEPQTVADVLELMEEERDARAGEGGDAEALLDLFARLLRRALSREKRGCASTRKGHAGD